jgi:hypothetical protein
MFPLIETAIAFAAAMLAASLFVTAVVQVLQKLLGLGPRTTRDMLEALMYGFRDFHNDPAIDAAETAGAASDKRENVNKECARFALDILSDRALHTRAAVLAYQDQPEKLAKRTEYVDPDDLTRLVETWARYASATEAAARPRLPRTWVGDKLVKTPEDFAKYVEGWFSTYEGTASERFKTTVRRLTLLVSAVVVVLFNLDGFRLVRTLASSDAARIALNSQVESLQTSAARLGVEGAELEPGDALDETTKERLLELQKTAGILDEADAGLGWQGSFIVGRWCAYTQKCASPDSPPTKAGIALDTLSWLGGLLFSLVMLSLGAPFWYRTLSQLINVKNAVRARKEDERKEGEHGKTSARGRPETYPSRSSPAWTLLWSKRR